MTDDVVWLMDWLTGNV